FTDNFFISFPILVDSFIYLLFLRLLPPPPSTLFPYTTLFRSPFRELLTPTVFDVFGSDRPEPDGQPANQARFDGLPGFVKATLEDRKSTRLNSSHVSISYAVFCLKKKTESQ